MWKIYLWCQTSKINYEKIDAFTHKMVIINGAEVRFSDSINLFLLENRINTLQKLNELGEENLTEELKKLKHLIQYPERYTKEELANYKGVYFGHTEAEKYPKYDAYQLKKNRKNSEFLELIAIIEEKIKLNKSISQSEETNKSEHKPLKI